MSAREIMADWSDELGLDLTIGDAELFFGALTASGHVILSPDEVRGIRDLTVWALDEVGCDVQLTPGLDIALKALEARDG